MRHLCWRGSTVEGTTTQKQPQAWPRAGGQGAAGTVGPPRGWAPGEEQGEQDRPWPQPPQVPHLPPGGCTHLAHLLLVAPAPCRANFSWGPEMAEMGQPSSQHRPTPFPPSPPGSFVYAKPQGNAPREAALSSSISLPGRFSNPHLHQAPPFCFPPGPMAPYRHGHAVPAPGNEEPVGFPGTHLLVFPPGCC